MLQDKAIIIKVSLSCLSDFKFDRRITREVAANHGGNERSFRSAKRILPEREVIKSLQSIDREIRAYVGRYTRPWLADGWKLLPNRVYFEFMGGLNKLFNKREELVNQLDQEWDDIKQEKLAEDSAFQESDFPDDVKKQFTVDVMFLPVPRKGDFRAPDGLDEDDVAKIEEETMKRIEDKFNSKDLWQRIKNELTTNSGTLGDRLRAYDRDADGKVVNSFHDTLITNIRELVEMLPKLNISDDPDLDGMTKMLEHEVASKDPDKLREDSALRESVATEADKILDMVSIFMGA